MKREHVYQLRMSAEEKARYQKAASLSGITLAVWIRQTLTPASEAMINFSITRPRVRNGKLPSPLLEVSIPKEISGVVAYQPKKKKLIPLPDIQKIQATAALEIQKNMPCKIEPVIGQEPKKKPHSFASKQEAKKMQKDIVNRLKGNWSPK